jgi:hypothetical protein
MLKILSVIQKQMSFIEKNSQRNRVSIYGAMAEGCLKIFLYKMSVNGIFQKV